MIMDQNIKYFLFVDGSLQLWDSEVFIKCIALSCNDNVFPLMKGDIIKIKKISRYDLVVSHLVFKNNEFIFESLLFRDIECVLSDNNHLSINNSSTFEFFDDITKQVEREQKLDRIL